MDIPQKLIDDYGTYVSNNSHEETLQDAWETATHYWEEHPILHKWFTSCETFCSLLIDEQISVDFESATATIAEYIVTTDIPDNEEDYPDFDLYKNY